MIREVTMYRLVCDADGCGETAPSADSEISAWSDIDGCYDDAEDAGWWHSGDRKQWLCVGHQPPWCDYCGEQHLPEKAAAK